MAEKLLKAKKKKIVPSDTRAASMRPPREIVLVGTYKERQLAWIKKYGVYNYPVKDGDEFDAESFAKIKELWLYADAKGRRRCFTADFVGKMSREEFIASYPTYADIGRARTPYPPSEASCEAGAMRGAAPNGRARARPSAVSLRSAVREPYKAYYVFKTTFLDYGPKLDDPDVLIRAMDFATGRGRTKSVKKAYDQYKADGEFAPLAAYLPTELSQVPRERLRVCEAAVQMEFLELIGISSSATELSIEEVAQREHASIKVIRRLVASGQLSSVRRGARYFIPESSLKAFHTKQSCGVIGAANTAEVHFVKGQGIDPEQREMRRRGKRIGVGVSRSVRPRKTAVERKIDVVNWQDISGVWDHPGHSREMTFVDLFCGAGGLSKGLEMAGLEGICGLDWFDEAGLTYARNFDHPFINGDIKLAENKERFYETVAERLHGRQLSLVAGGFPCQGFSMSGNRIVDDPRNSLYRELIEIVEHLQPEFVLCENVKGLRSMLHGAVEEEATAA